MILAALLASGAALFLGGFLVGLYVNRGIRRIPEHPSLGTATRHERTLRFVIHDDDWTELHPEVVESHDYPIPYDWKNADEQ